MKTKQKYYWAAGLILQFGMYFYLTGINNFWLLKVRGMTESYEAMALLFLLLAVTVALSLFLFRKAKPDRFKKLLCAGIAVIVFSVLAAGVIPFLSGAYHSVLSWGNIIGCILFICDVYAVMLQE